MYFRFQIFAASFLAVGLFFCQPLPADLTLDFSSDGGSLFNDRFEVEVGDLLQIDIFLRQSDPDTILVDEGLVAWGFDLTRSPVENGVILSRTVNPLFDFENHNVVTSSGFEWEFGETASLGVKGENVLLGSFQYRATMAGETTFTIEDRLVGGGAANASWLTPSFADLDEQIFGVGAADTYQFTVNAVTAVPEPSSAVVLFGGLMLGVATRRRRS